MNKPQPSLIQGWRFGFLAAINLLNSQDVVIEASYALEAGGGRHYRAKNIGKVATNLAQKGSDATAC